MKVYIVSKGYDYQPNWIVGVFDSPDKADDLMRKEKEDKFSHTNVWVDEWEVM